MSDIEMIFKYSIILTVLFFSIFLYIKSRNLSYLFLIFLQAFAIVFMYISDINNHEIENDFINLIYIFTVIFPLVLFFNHLLKLENHIFSKKQKKYHQYQMHDILLRINEQLKLYSAFSIFSIEKNKSLKLKKLLISIKKLSLEEKLTNYKSLSILYSKNPFVHYNLGMLYYEKEDYSNAFSCFLKSIVFIRMKKIRKTSRIISKTYCQCGNCFLKTSKITEAIYCYKKSIKINNNNLQAKENLVFAYLLYSKPNKALKYYDNNLHKTNKSFLYALHLYIGKYYEKNNDFEKALDSFEMAKNTKKTQEIDLLKAKTLYNLGKYNKAERLFRQILEVNSKNKSAIYGIALCFSKTEKYEKAIEFFKESIEYKESAYNLAYIYYKQEQYTNCIDFLEKEIKNKNATPKIYKLLSNAYYKMLRYIEAKNVLEKCAQKFKYDINILFNLGVINYHLKNYKEAQIYFLKAHSYSKEDIDILIYLIKTNLELNNYIDVNSIIKKEFKRISQDEEALKFIKKIEKEKKLVSLKHLEKTK